VHNQLLAALPDGDRQRLMPSLEVIPLKLKELLHRAGAAIDYVYFPGDGFVSIVAILEDGGMVETATVGREGMVGVLAVREGTVPLTASMVQGEGNLCYRMTAHAFRLEMANHGAFYDLMTRFSQALLSATMQGTACNAVHSVEQRLARWLLMAEDRMGAREFLLTQEFMAMMLGATRPTVTVVAGTLQRAGLITYHRGRLKILDRERLEQASCECYRVMTDLFTDVTRGGGRFASIN
jgi:CRP-like cAMP-binding protein